jgi:hypothetical protein
MTGMRRSLWKSATAQAAVFALLFQTLLSAFGCFTGSLHPSHASFSVNASNIETATVVICTQQGMKSIAASANGGDHSDVPLNAPHSDCALCLSHICCSSALAPPGEAVVFAPATLGVVVAMETWRSPSSADVLSLRNRGPPSFQLS